MQELIYYLNHYSTITKMEKYIYKTDFDYDNDICCAERCLVKDDGTMIGSIACKRCEFCKGYKSKTKVDKDSNWIKCEKLTEAKYS